MQWPSRPCPVGIRAGGTIEYSKIWSNAGQNVRNLFFIAANVTKGNENDLSLRYFHGKNFLHSFLSHSVPNNEEHGDERISQGTAKRLRV